MRVVTFDIETSNIFADVGKNDPTLLDLAIICIHDSETDTYTSYLQADLPKLWQILEHTDMLVGWNSDHFDLPLLNKYYPGDLTQIKSLDLMKEVQASMGRRLKLDTVAEATLGTKKSGDGLQALTWWKNGEIERVRDYCIKDVEITKKIYDYALKKGHLKYKELSDIKKVALDTSSWLTVEEKVLTHTLPF